jgi:hypothetical protein
VIRGLAPPFLNSALDGGGWSASRPGLFTPEEITPDTHWIGGWVGLRTGLDDVKGEKSFLYRGLLNTFNNIKSTFSAMYKALKYICSVTEKLTHVFRKSVQILSSRVLF